MASYKVLPFIGQIKSGFFSNENAGTVAQQLQAAIEQQVTAGWELHSVAKVNSEVKLERLFIEE